MRTAQLVSALIALSASAVLAAAQSTLSSPTAPTKQSPAAYEVWIEPTDLESRDLLRGPAFGPPPPNSNTAFTFVKEDTNGRSPGYDVRDASGVVWSVKLGPEAQSEVLSSRILWAIGFHQPPTYYVGKWTLSGGPQAGPQQGGRFRPELPTHKVADDWKWDENPYVNTRPMAGLLVAQMMLNNWDLKSSNNKIYELGDGKSGTRRLYIVRDLGASLGSNEQAKWIRWLGIRAAQGSKNDLEGFEESGFIDGIEDGHVKFSYRGPNESLLDSITAEDVRWTVRLMSRLSDRQWRDAFRAAGYSDADAARFIAKLKQKIAQGLSLT